MKGNQSKHAVEKMCSTFKVSRSGYYDWLGRKPSKRQIETDKLKAEVRMIYKASKNRYGSPKITSELTDRGWVISRPRVARIMRSEGIRSIVNKKYKCATTDSNHSLAIAKNHLNRNFSASLPGQKWVSDITYIPTKQGWLYLTTVLDLFDRKIIGWALSSTMTAKDTVVAAWCMAIKNRPAKGVLFHSDRGVQYASHEFRKEIKRYEVIQSMSRKGNCWDNAVAESFFKILKSEMVNHFKYQSILHAKNDIFEFIEIWYNRKRKHAYLGYKTPEQYGKINYSKCA
jgi:transposase InsO family protein